MMMRKLLTTVGRGQNSLKFSTAQLPSNLLVADMKIFEEPKPKIIIDPESYYFPTLNVPKSIPVHKFNVPGTFAASAHLEQKIFEVAIRKDIIHDNVRFIRHQKRQPNRTKRMADISGSNKKPYPQKGGGYSQVGNKRNSSWRKGMTAHGPVLRDFSIKLNRKVRALGMMMVFAAKYREGNLAIFEELKTPTHKTKEFATLLAEHGLADVRTLFIDENFDLNFWRSSQNLQKVLSMERRHMNVYTILQHEKLVLGKETFLKIQEQLMEQYNHKGRRKAIEARQSLLDKAQQEASANA